VTIKGGKVMKKSLVMLASAAIVIVACQESLNPTIDSGKGVYATIEQPDFISTKALDYSSDGKLTFKWAAGDQIMVYGSDASAIYKVGEDGSSVTKLESESFTLNNNLTYYTFSPVEGTLSEAPKTAIPVSFENQVQTANSNTEHLRLNQYACAEAKVENNSVNFQFLNQVAWVYYSHTFESEVKAAKVVMSVSEGEPFVLEGTLDATAGVSEKGYTTSIKATKTSNEMTLTLGENGFDIAEGTSLDAFFTVHPVDLTGKVVTVKVFDAEGVELSSESFAGRAIARNAFIKFTENSQKPVASLNGVEYVTVNDAINAAVNGTKSVTIDILEDISENLVIEDTNEKGRTITLDFHGKKLSVIGESAVAVLVKSRGSDNFRNTLQIKNAIISSEFVGIKFDPKTSRTDLALYDCTINSAQGAVCTSQAVGSQIRIYGGYFSATNNAVIAGNGSNREGRNIISLNASSTTKEAPVIVGKTSTSGDAACGIYAPWKDVITINAAKINVENGVGILSRGGKITINNAEIVTTEPSEGYKGSVGDSRVVVPCKTVFIDTECDYPALSEASILIKGGKYSDNAGASYLTQGYSYAETGESPLAYEIVSSETKLIQDINSVAENGTVLVENYVSLKSEPIKIQKNFNLELAENAVITAESGSNVLNFCKENGNNTITGTGTVIGPKASSSAAIWVGGENQTLTIDGNVTIKGGESTNDNNDAASAVNIYNGKLVINNGTFISGTDATGNNSPVIYLCPRSSETAVLEINGGIFKSVSGNAEYLINCQDDVKDRCKVSIKGGTFYGFNPADNSADGDYTNYVADGYTVNYDEASNSYTVVEATGSTISSQEDLNKAITGAVQGEAVTITLSSNSTFTLDNGIANEGTNSRNITIEGNGTQTVDVVTEAVTAEGGELNYQRGSSFTFKNVIIKAGEGDFDGIVCDELTYEKCTIKGKLTLYGKATFIDCVFENDMANQYSIWTWGGTDIKFEGCTFNTNGKAILLYGQNRTTNLTVSGCTFNDRKGSAGKAAIEIHTEAGVSGTLNISTTKIASGFNDRLWWEGNNVANPKYDTKKFTIKIDGETIQTAE